MLNIMQQEWTAVHPSLYEVMKVNTRLPKFLFPYKSSSSSDFFFFPKDESFLMQKKNLVKTGIIISHMQTLH